MPVVHLTTFGTHLTLPVREPGGRLRLLPRTQFRCWLRLPNVIYPRDAIIDTGSPFTWLPQDVWEKLQPADYEILAFPTGYAPPRAQTAGWSFTFRFARFLQPIGLHDGATELTRDGVIVQLADGNPPVPPGSQRPAVVVVGLWGGVLEGTALRTSADATRGHTVGVLEW